ncbi:hypothetical protein BN3087_940002 [Sulfurovum sp. enrichment culture clone C5]|uniref:Uncharacterized protein n=1 Tax=Sulfurovum sp. enrichment culture clone C5 TaxID=497650 RepID=A0A0S4XRQ9_9BACT|nr:hypothetical protein BN3087_940002 [Sulfurovum sp. enrichment culture clone C5]
MTIAKYDGKIISKAIVLMDSQDNYLVISNQFFSFPSSICEPIQNIEDLKHYQSNLKQTNMCQNLFNMIGTNFKILNINGYQIFVYFEKEKSNAFVFNNKQLVAIVSSDMKATNFLKILKNIQKNQFYNKYDIDYYIDRTKYFLGKGKVNIATRYFYSSLWISNNSKLQSLQTTLQDIKSKPIVYIYEAKNKDQSNQ